MEISRNVHRLTVGEPAFPGVYPPNVFLVTGKRAAFVDTGYERDDEVRVRVDYWRALGEPEVAAIVLTHRHADHIGGAGRIREATGAPIVCSLVEKDFVQSGLSGAGVDRVVYDGETLDLGGAVLEFIHTPGHTLGSLCVLYREEGALFTGDTILGTGTTSVNPEQGDMGLYVESLHKLLSYDARALYPGHGPEIHEPGAKIRELIEHRLGRERDILNLLKGGKRTLDELFAAMYVGLDSRLHGAARNQVRSHLMKLEREGKVAPLQGGDGGYALR